MNTFVSYLVVLIMLGILDALWLGVVCKNFYRANVGSLYREKTVWGAVILFYLFYAAAIVYFAVLPSAGVWRDALIPGAALGFTGYMMYQLVNYAMLKGWSAKVVVVDIIWGTILTACVSMAATAITAAF